MLQWPHAGPLLIISRRVAFILGTVYLGRQWHGVSHYLLAYSEHNTIIHLGQCLYTLGCQWRWQEFSTPRSCTLGNTDTSYVGRQQYCVLHSWFCTPGSCTLANTDTSCVGRQQCCVLRSPLKGSSPQGVTFTTLTFAQVIRGTATHIRVVWVISPDLIIIPLPYWTHLAAVFVAHVVSGFCPLHFPYTTYRYAHHLNGIFRSIYQSSLEHKRLL